MIYITEEEVNRLIRSSISCSGSCSHDIPKMLKAQLDEIKIQREEILKLKGYLSGAHKLSALQDYASTNKFLNSSLKEYNEWRDKNGRTSNGSIL